jgi:putative acetyltransferase
VTWSPEYKFRAAFRSLNWERFEGIYNLEEEDITQLENPQNIIKDGGEIFYLMHHDVIMGTVAVVVENCEYEVAWMSIGKDYIGFGFPHALLVVITNWARLRGLPGLSVLTSTSWGNAVSLYETHGFQVVNVGDQGSNARYDTALRLCL